MSIEMEKRASGISSSTKIEDFSNSNIQVHIVPETKEVVLVSTNVVEDGSGCIEKLTETVGWFKNITSYRSFVNLI